MQTEAAATEEVLETQLDSDLKTNDPRAYHDHIYYALLHGLSEAQIRKAIEAGQTQLANNIAAERAKEEGTPVTAELLAQVKADLQDYADNELDTANLRASFEDMSEIFE